MLCSDPNVMGTRFAHQKGLRDTFDAALAGCALVFSCLDEEVRRLMQGVGEGERVRRGARAKFLWKEDKMRELLLSMRGQHSTIMSLVQCLQMFVVRRSVLLGTSFVL